MKSILSVIIPLGSLVLALPTVLNAKPLQNELGEKYPAMQEATNADRVSTAFWQNQLVENKDIVIMSDPMTITANRAQRGTSVPIPMETIETLCGDIDGCTLRMGMYNWDGQGFTASSSNLFYYNMHNGAWRAEEGDSFGVDFNINTEHVMQAWGCYFTDGTYDDWVNLHDYSKGFSLLAWNQYSAEECRLTIVD